MAVRLVHTRSPLHLRRRSEKTDDLLISVGMPWIARHGVLIRLVPGIQDALIFLAAHQGCTFCMAEMVNAIYGDHEDGGPLHANSALNVYLHEIKRLRLLIGLHVKSSGGRGARLFIVPHQPMTRQDRCAP